MTRRVARYLHRGEVVTLEGSSASMTLLDHLRLERKLFGTKEGCNEGDCGACTVVLARVRNGKIVHQPVNSCILPAGQIDGAELITVEDLAVNGSLHPVQQAMVDKHGSQCGFCTPGIVMSLFALFQEGERPVTRHAVNDQLAGNLCRCTGYRPIIDAALEACTGPATDTFVTNARERIKAIQALDNAEDIFIGDDSSFFAAPATIDSLAALFVQFPDATLIGGATDVGLWLTKKLQHLPRIIWLGRVAGLDHISQDTNGLELGATVTLLAAHGILADLDTDLGEVIRRFGSTQVRATATIGGNIANGSPIGDLAPCLIALDADVMLQCSKDQRRMPLERFFVAYGKQDRRPGEFLRSVTIPALRAGQVFRAFKVSKRFDEDISAVLAAFRFDLTERKIVSTRFAFGGMAGTPKRATATEQALSGASLDDPASWEAAIDALGIDFQPLDDLRASSTYRLATARALLQKALFEVSGAPTAVTRIIGHRENPRVAP